MGKDKAIRPNDLSDKLAEGFQRARKKLIEEEKKNNGFLIVADKNGKVVKIPARDL